MAIAVNSVTQGPQSTATSWTWSHTCSGEDRILLVYGHQTDTVTSVKYNNVSMTLAKAQGSGGTGVKIWYLVAPDTGTHNIVATSSSNTFIRYSSISYTGVDQTSPINTTGGTTASGTGITCTVNTTVNNCWTTMVVVGSGTLQSLTLTSPTTWRVRIGGDGQVGAFDSNSALSSGSNSLQISGGGSATWSGAIVGLAPVPELSASNLTFFSMASAIS